MTARGARVMVPVLLAAAVVASGARADEPAVARPDGIAQETLSEVRVHGNTHTPEADVLKLAGLTVGQPLDQAAIDAAETRLRQSGRFEAVEIRKRHRSLDGGPEVALVIIVQEHPARGVGLPGLPVLSWIDWLMGNGMFLPVLNYADGYGLTYGARIGFADTPRRGSRLSVPLTWGGTKRAAVELDRPLGRGPFEQLTGGAAAWRRTNPFYGLDEDRGEVWLGASRDLVPGFRAEVRGSVSEVRFGSINDRAGLLGATLTYDTRIEPSFPRNAVLLAAGWDVLDSRQYGTVGRVRADLRGFLGVVRQSVLCLRIQYAAAGGALPAYERVLLGGAGTLRGHRPGSFSGDNLAAATAELRIPLSSPFSIGRMGLTLFADTGTAYDHGERLGDARFHHGAGAGFFLAIGVAQLNADVGFRPGGGTRFHLSTGLQF